MEEDRDDIVELDVPPPPPPRLEVQPDSDPPAEEHDPFAQIFPPILRAERPKLPRSIRTYTSTFMDRDSFMDQFKDTPSLFTPPAMDRAFKPQLGPHSRELDGLLWSATDRAGHAFAPLMAVATQLEDPAHVQTIALATLAIGQCVAQLNYMRRFNSLREVWGPTRIDAVRQAILRGQEDGVFEDGEHLFGEQFTESCKNYAQAPKPPAAATKSYTTPAARGKAPYRPPQPQRPRQAHASQHRNDSKPYNNPKPYSSKPSKPYNNRLVGDSGQGGTQFFRCVAPHGRAHRKMGKSHFRPRNFIMGQGCNFRFGSPSPLPTISEGRVPTFSATLSDPRHTHTGTQGIGNNNAVPYSALDAKCFAYIYRFEVIYSDKNPIKIAPTKPIK